MSKDRPTTANGNREGNVHKKHHPTKHDKHNKHVKPNHQRKRTSPKNRADEDPSELAMGGTNHILRGPSHTQLLHHKTLQTQTLPNLKHSDPAKHERVMAHYSGGVGRSDLAFGRLTQLKKADKLFHKTGNYGERNDMEDPTNLNPRMRRALNKRNRPNMSLVRQIHRRETKRLSHALMAADAEEILHPHTSGRMEAENDMERTGSVSQEVLKREHLNEASARNVFELSLEECAPYGLKYDRAGRHALLYGQRRGRGHVAIVDQHTLALKNEFYLPGETVRDATFLQHGGLGGGGGMMAVAQEKKVYIYDDVGVEIHRLDHHTRVGGMEFLPYHWLLATIGQSGLLQYQDTSTGVLTSQHRTKLGPSSLIRQNPYNAVIHLGHNNGIVTLWSPSSSEYLVKLLCHGGNAVTSLAIDRSGRYMATGAGAGNGSYGGKGVVKIWDLRMYRELHSYNTFGGAPTSLDISQTGILGVSHGCHTTFFPPEALKRKVSPPESPYMRHDVLGKGPIQTLRFRPFEDVCGLGHARGISSIVIPGSGEPNLDSMEHFTNPYMDARQRREVEVKSLMEKLSPDMICLNPMNVGSVEDGRGVIQWQKRQDEEREREERREREKEEEKGKKEKRRMRGRSKIGNKLKRRQKNVVDEGVVKLREMRELEKREKEGGGDGNGGGGEDGGEEAPAALKRFFS